MERWSGRVAIVTGASAGIGAGIAQILVENGMKVVGVARRTDPIKEMRAELVKYSGELHAIEGDVTKEEDVKRIVKWTRENLGGVDVLVNNAGVALGCPLTDFDTEKFRRVWETNVFGLSLFTRDAIKDMRERGVNGHIFHISSVMGQKVTNIERFPHLGVYSSTKHAVKTLTEYLRQELRDAKSEIKITSISPGLVKTDIVTAASGSEKKSDDVFEVNPTLTIRDVAETLLFALSTPPSVQLNWYAARDWCRAHGMDLVTVDSAAEDQLLVNYQYNYYVSNGIAKASTSFFWTGLNDQAVDRSFTWVATGKPLGSYTNWSTGQPAQPVNDPEHCGEYMYRDTPKPSWNDRSCTATGPFICEVNSPCKCFV